MSENCRGGPEISVVVVVYRMQREAPRTLRSLTAAYQQGVGEDQYEVIVVENSSDQMLSAEEVRRHGRQFRYLVNPRASRSPAGAINLGAREALGRYVMLIIDGARMLSPGVLRRTLTALRLYDRPVVATLAWHLGPDNQARSIHKGYCQEVEDRLLAQSGWETDGYVLFKISSLAGSCENGWFFPMAESNCLTMDREHFEALGGYSEEFQSPGGGFLNLDFYARAVADSNRPLIILLGEGSFHQVHGGVATNRRDDESLRLFREEYERLRGRPFATPQTIPIYLGSMPEPAKLFMRRSFNKAQELNRQRFPHFDGTQGHARNPVANPGEPLAARSPSRALTVLGMHRSGTSALAGMLMECGVDFGDVSRWNKHNIKGNNEQKAIMDLHDRLLDDNGGAWNRPPERVRWESGHRQARDAILRPLRATRSAWWGFKDPRTLLTLDGWIEVVPEMRLVGIFRQPEAVAQSLTSRNSGISRIRGLDLWCRYNLRLIALYRQRPFPILYFSEEPEQFRQQLLRLAALLGLKPPPQGLQFFEPELTHFDPLRAEPLPQEVSDLYGELHAVAFYQPEVQRSLFEERQPA